GGGTPRSVCRPRHFDPVRAAWADGTAAGDSAVSTADAAAPPGGRGRPIAVSKTRPQPPGRAYGRGRATDLSPRAVVTARPTVRARNAPEIARTAAPTPPMVSFGRAHIAESCATTEGRAGATIRILRSEPIWGRQGTGAGLSHGTPGGPLTIFPEGTTASGL